MGSFFSSPAIDTDEYLKAIEETEKEIAQNILESQQNEEKMLKLAQEIENYARTLQEKQKREQSALEQRVIGMKDAARERYMKVASVITEVLFNRVHGVADIDNTRSDLLKFYSDHLNEDVFWMLAKIPVFLPVIWPTGKGDEAFHTGGDFKKLLPDYIKNKLTKCLYNVSIRNFLYVASDKSQQSDARTSIVRVATEYVNEAVTKTSDVEFLKLTFQFLQKNYLNDVYQWRALRAMANKGICEKVVKTLPATYPRYCNEYEFREAVVMLLNLCINRYGAILDKFNMRVKEISKATTLGGKCFNLDKSAATKVYEMCLKSQNDAGYWDCETYIEATDIGITSGAPVANYKPCEEYTLIEQDNMSFLKYVNPFSKYISNVLNTVIAEEFETDHMAGISCTINPNLINTIINVANTDVTISPLNPNIPAMNNNHFMMSAFDLISTNTSIGEEYLGPDASSVPSLSKLVYQLLIKNNSSWNLIIPINNVMSSSQINYHIENQLSNKCIPQYMFARSKVVPEKAGSSGKAYAVPSYSTVSKTNPNPVQIQ